MKSAIGRLTKVARPFARRWARQGYFARRDLAELRVSRIAHLAAAMGRTTAAVFTGETDPQRSRPIGPGGCVKVFRQEPRGGREVSPTDVVEHLKVHELHE